MDRANGRRLVAALVVGAAIACAAPVAADAATPATPSSATPAPPTTVGPTVTASSQGVPECVISPAEKQTAAQEISAGTPLSTICSDPTLVDQAATTSLLQGSASAALLGVTADDESECGDAKDNLTPNDPQTGWFHEEPEIDDVDTGFLTGTVTAYWANETETAYADNYSWSIAPFTTSFDADRDVDSHPGYIDAYAIGAAELLDGTTCGYYPTPLLFYVSD